MVRAPLGTSPPPQVGHRHPPEAAAGASSSRRRTVFLRCTAFASCPSARASFSNSRIRLHNARRAQRRWCEPHAAGDTDVQAQGADARNSPLALRHLAAQVLERAQCSLGVCLAVHVAHARPAQARRHTFRCQAAQRQQVSELGRPGRRAAQAVGRAGAPCTHWQPGRISLDALELHEQRRERALMRLRVHGGHRLTGPQVSRTATTPLAHRVLPTARAMAPAHTLSAQSVAQGTGNRASVCAKSRRLVTCHLTLPPPARVACPDCHQCVRK